MFSHSNSSILSCQIDIWGIKENSLFIKRKKNVVIALGTIYFKILIVIFTDDLFLKIGTFGWKEN